MKNQGFVLLPTILALLLISAFAFMLVRSSSLGISTLDSDLQYQKAKALAEAGLARALWGAQIKPPFDSCVNYQDIQEANLGNDGAYSAQYIDKSGSPATVVAQGKLTNGYTVKKTARVRVYSNEYPKELDSVLEVNSIDENNPGVSGNARISVGANGHRTLLRFSIPLIPSGATIESATLQMGFSETLEDQVINKVKVYSVTKGWDNTANWSLPWEIPGGDYDKETGFGGVVKEGTLALWDITAFVKKWYLVSGSNMGVMMISDGPSFDPVVTPVSAKIVVKYRCDCSAYCCRYECYGLTANDSKKLNYLQLDSVVSDISYVKKPYKLNYTPNFYFNNLCNRHLVLYFDKQKLDVLNGATIVAARLNMYVENDPGVSSMVYVRSITSENYNACTGYYSMSDSGLAGINKSRGVLSVPLFDTTVNEWVKNPSSFKGLTLFFNDSVDVNVLVSSTTDPFISGKSPPRLVIVYTVN